LKKGRIFLVFLNILILASWVMMMILLVKREGMLKPRGVQGNFRELIPQDIELDAWKSIYISHQWAGYIHMVMGPYTEGNRKGYLINGTSLMRFNMFDQLKEIEITSVQVLDADFRVLKFEARISGMTHIMVTGKRLGENMLMEIRYGKSRYKKVFAASDDLFLENSILSIYRGKGLNVGDTYTLNLFNPVTFTVEPTDVRVVGRKDDLLLLETKFSGLSSKSWIDKDGQVVREEAANGWVMKLETQEEVERHMSEHAHNGVDILTEAAVITRRRIQSPRQVGFMRIKVSGIDLGDFPFDGERQDLVDRKEGIVEIRAIAPSEQEAISLPYEGGRLKQYLRPSLWIQSSDPAIIKTAEGIIGEERDGWRAAKMINTWVHKNVNKSFSVGIPVATSVLVNREGDCNEHTVLFVALARACGIPAEMCAGFVYLEDGFYYHAWPKVFVGRWVHCDPTFGQPVADATHFELVSGDLSAQAKLAVTLGRIGIEILDAQVWRKPLDRD